MLNSSDTDCSASSRSAFGRPSKNQSCCCELISTVQAPPEPPPPELPPPKPPPQETSTSSTSEQHIPAPARLPAHAHQALRQLEHNKHQTGQNDANTSSARGTTKRVRNVLAKPFAVKHHLNEVENQFWQSQNHHYTSHSTPPTSGRERHCNDRFRSRGRHTWTQRSQPARQRLGTDRPIR